MIKDVSCGCFCGCCKSGRKLGNAVVKEKNMLTRALGDNYPLSYRIIGIDWGFFMIGNKIYSIPKRLLERLAPLVIATSPQSYSSLPSGQPCKVSTVCLQCHHLLFKNWRICSEEKWQAIPALWEIVFLPHWRLLSPCTIALVPLCFEENRMTPGYNANCILLFDWVFFKTTLAAKRDHPKSLQRRFNVLQGSCII